MKSLKFVILAAILMVVPTESVKGAIFSIPGTDVKIVIEKFDITKISKVEAIVNAANSQLAGGSGVCGAIFKAAGWDKLQKACNEYPLQGGVRCPTGQARITDSFDLKNHGVNYIIHAVGPDCRIITDSAQQDLLLEQTYQNSLMLAVQNDVASIAFPFISSGIYGFPKDRAAKIAIETVYQYVLNNKTMALKSIHFVLFSQPEYDLFCKFAGQVISTAKLALKTVAQPVVQSAVVKKYSLMQKVIRFLKNSIAWITRSKITV